MGLQQLQGQVYGLFCDVRSLDYVIKSKGFENAYGEASPEARQAIEVIIRGIFELSQAERIEALRFLHDWIKEKSDKEKTISQLRDLAQVNHIRGYSRMSKMDLISALANLKKASNANGNSNSNLGTHISNPDGAT